MKCIKCGAEIDEKSVHCMYCGKKVKPQKGRFTLIVLFSFFICLCIIGFVILYFVKLLPEKNIKTINYVYEKYNNNTISYDDAKNELYQLKEKLGSNYVEEIDDVSNKITRISESKAVLETADEYFSKDDYKSAIKVYEEIEESDECYNEAQEKKKEALERYREHITEVIDDYISKNKYSEAIDFVEKSKDYIDENEYSNTLTSLKEQYRVYHEQLAEEARNKGDYNEEVLIYKEMKEVLEDDTYDLKIKEIEDNVVKEAIEEAENYLKEGKIDEAKEVISKAQKSFISNSDLVSEKSRIENCVPKPLTDFKIIDSTGYWYSIKNGIDTNTGETVFSGFSFRGGTTMSKSKKPSTGEIEYLLNGNYDKLSGTLALSDDFKNTRNTCKINIYADDELKYTSKELSKGALPFDFEVDISNAEILKIEYVIEESSKGKIEGIVIDPQVKKTID